MKKVSFILFAVLSLCLAGCSKEKVENHNVLTIGEVEHPLHSMLALAQAQTVYAYDADDTCEHFHIFGHFAKELIGHSADLAGQASEYDFSLGINSNNSSWGLYAAPSCETGFSSGEIKVYQEDGMYVIVAEGILKSGEIFKLDMAVEEDKIENWVLDL